MSFHGYVTSATRERIIQTQQTGTVTETPEDWAVFLRGEIKKLENSLTLRKVNLARAQRKHDPKAIAGHEKDVKVYSRMLETARGKLAEADEQVRILQAITPEAQTEFEAEIKTASY